MNTNFYKNKTVLVTGHTGFKGSWLSIWLNELGARVIGYALDPYSDNDNFVLSAIKDKIVDIRGDIRDAVKLESVFERYRPDMVFHLAAQPLVRLSYEIPVETYQVNVMGTINVLEAMRKHPETKVGIFITTDKCYENREQIWGYREDDALGGYDPYSSSKGACEIAINSWRKSFFNPSQFERHGQAIASVRAGNVIGGGDWAADRIIPDCIRAIEASQIIEIRSPKAIRPWEHVLEPLGGYLLLAEKLWDSPCEYAQAWNFGPGSGNIVNVWDVAMAVTESYGQGTVKDVSTEDAPHEAGLLLLDISKAIFKLGWTPKLTFKQTIDLTVDWYRQYRTRDVYELCVEQLKQYLNYGNK